MKSLKFRQKIIQLAGQSEFSWNAAEEYEVDELAGMTMTPSTWKAKKVAEQKVIKCKNGMALRQGKKTVEPGLIQQEQPVDYWQLSSVSPSATKFVPVSWECFWEWSTPSCARSMF